MENDIYNFPCVFGRICPKRSPYLLELPDSVDTVFNSGENLQIFKKGQSDEIHILKTEEKYPFIVSGRIYQPISINPFFTRNNNFDYTTLVNSPDLQGNFNIILVSEASGQIKIFFITDKYGFRRILYFLDDGCLFFATHLSGLKVLLGDRLPPVSSQALLHYYNFGVTSNDQSILEGIKKIPPGSTLTYADGKITIEKYFDVSELYHPEQWTGRDEAEICQAIDQRLLESVRKRIPGDGPVGVALSGGVDSGYLAQKIRQTDAEVVGYHLSYKGFYDELDRVNKLAQILGLEVRQVSVTPGQVINNFEYVNGLGSEPIGFNNATMRFVALEAQKDRVRALFDGDGADRIFLGMNRYLQFKKAVKSYAVLRKLGLLPVVTPILGFLPHVELQKLYLHFQNWQRGIAPYPERILGDLEKYDLSYEQKIYDLAVKRFRENFQREVGLDDFGLYFTYHAIQMCPEMFFYDPAEIQTELGLFPVPGFWDDDLVSVALSLPTAMKLRGKQTKYILRKAAAKNLDPQYWMLPKIGLQNSFNFVIQSPEGRAWQNRERKKVVDSAEYRMLKEIVPGGRVNPERLIGLIVWKEQQGIS